MEKENNEIKVGSIVFHRGKEIEMEVTKIVEVYNVDQKKAIPSGIVECLYSQNGIKKTDEFNIKYLDLLV